MNLQSQNFCEFRRYEMVIAYKLIFPAARLLNVSIWPVKVHTFSYMYIRMVFYRSKGIIALWVNSRYVLVSVSWKLKFMNSHHYAFWNWKNPKAKFRTGADEHNFADFHLVSVICLFIAGLSSTFVTRSFWKLEAVKFWMCWCQFNLPVASVEPGFMPTWLLSCMIEVHRSHWSAGPRWAWESAQLRAVATFSREHTSALIRASLLQH